ncbi:MAG: HelD family protein, partial [Acidimicrobiales bacterium]
GEAGLVFGRTDDAEGVRRHIGRVAVDDEDHEPLVMDWRAPAAEPFYRATGAHPMGLVRRRHLTLRGRKVVRLDDELLTAPGANGDGLVLMGEGALMAALERSRTGRMSDIVATIQAEQDEIVRAPLAGVQVVQGGPGTGKTAVVLHRAAYLLYTHRFPLERAGVLLVGPSQVFLRYIQEVLPALGEDAVTLATPTTLSAVAARGTEPPRLARLKGDARMARVVAKAVADRQRPLPRPVTILVQGRRLTLTPRESARIVASAKRRPGSHNERRRVVERLVVRHMRGQWQEAGEPILEERPVFEALERMWPVLTPEELLHDLFAFPALVGLAAGGTLSAKEQSMLVRARTASPAEVAWTEADLPLLDEAARLLLQTDHASGWGTTFGHVLVDEAQDLSPMQLRMLARRCPSGSMTIVGDLAQASGAWAPRSWDDVLAHLRFQRPPRVSELTVNYRTPGEVMELAARVLAAAGTGVKPSRSVRFSGEDPVITSAGPGRLEPVVAETVASELALMGEGRLAVIAPDRLLDALRAVLPDAVEGTAALDAPVALLGVAQCKGLEFDSVVVVEPAAIVSQADAEGRHGRRGLYLALTRTTRRLNVVHSEPLPPEMG